MTSLSEHVVTYGNDKKILYYAAGPLQGPLLIFVHGWPAIAKTWIHQLTAFSALGFRVVAPDMPGYGGSTSNKVIEDYCQESIVEGMVALLADTGRDDAVWIGHDWGSGCVWSFVAHYPEKCRAVASLSVPYRCVELGLEELLKWSNREIYPEDKYPHAQWGYQAFYEQDFEKATAWFDSGVAGFMKFIFAKRPLPQLGQPSGTARTVLDGGWFGGPEKSPTPPAEAAFDNAEFIASDELMDDVIKAMKKTGFFGADAYYANHKRNRAYNTAEHVNPVLEMPVLYIEGKFDAICDTAVSSFATPQQKYCKKLTSTSIDCGHWIQMEKPAEVNAALARWLATEVKEYWPGFWKNGFVKNY
ncbi:Alpha/Beta hydrolase protein [Pseudomassariella vexata]|uniref:Alpha/Beta hydrolase protein n=1 Tax=Pseudomassariella vexata TaxID=1141098 RepID=A0A1Y2DY31_9PEZI|nr:Alpha/Beta hydrolase protein [Pseudomassariella vexata]ORY64208.1 Alpha/Beta hydrolase protein [Pseudomassariella vexata]